MMLSLRRRGTGAMFTTALLAAGVALALTPGCGGSEFSVVDGDGDIDGGAGAGGSGVAGSGSGGTGGMGAGGTQSSGGSAGAGGSGGVGASGGTGGDAGSAGSGASGGSAGAGASSGAGGAGGSGGSSGGSGSGGSGGTTGSGGSGGSGGTGGSVGACTPDSIPEAVYASAEDGNDAGDGSPQSPFRTIGAALAAASSRSINLVIVEEGTYPEAITMQPDTAIVIEGGWQRNGDDWVRDCSEDARTRTIIQSPGSVGVRAPATNDGAGLRRLTVRTPDVCNGNSSADDRSCIGVFVSGGGRTFLIDDVRVVAGRGGTPTAGGSVNPGGTRSCNGLTDCSADNGTSLDGPPGGSGQPGASSYTVLGYVPGDGTPGTNGGPGLNGRPGLSGDSRSCVTACTCSLPNLLSCDETLTPLQAGKGTCGCGGLGGSAGAGGPGGGASIAVYVFGPGMNVDIRGSDLVASDGGNGAPGGTGATGSSGGLGDQGDPVLCTLSCDFSLDVTICRCELSTTDVATLTGGAAGTAGGQGGPGGNGGGGSGGPSYAVIQGGGADVNADGATTLAHGTGGVGAGAALDGQSGDLLTAN